MELIYIDLTAMQGVIVQQGIQAKDGNRRGEPDLAESSFSTKRLAETIPK